MAIQPADTVYSVSEAFMLQRRDMQLTKDLMGGTSAMVRAGQRYLPKGIDEVDIAYNARLKATVLLNAYKRTVRFCRGQVFKKPVVIEDAKPGDALNQESVEWFKTWAEDVDRQGASLTEWSRVAFEAGINAGVTFALADYSAVNAWTDEAGRLWYQASDGPRLKTQEEDQRNGWGPYLVLVPAEQVLDVRVETQDGKQRIVHFRYIEDYEVPDGRWGKKRRQRIRAFFPGRYETWENSEDMADDFMLNEAMSGDMRMENGSALPSVPVAVFMPGDKRTAVTAEPALQDLAELNKRHWQASSAQVELMEFARKPVWFGHNLGDGEAPIQFGPGKLINATSEYATLQNVGVDAGSINAGVEELKNLEGQMALYGLQLLQPNSGTSAVTATEVTQDTEESTSALQDWALKFQDFLENCLKLIGQWRGWEDGPSVKVNTDFTRAVNIAFLLDLQQKGVIARRTLLEMLMRAGVLPDDFDVDAEPDRLAQELNTERGPAGTLNLDAILNRGRMATSSAG